MKLLKLTIGISFLLCGCSYQNHPSRNAENSKPSLGKVERVVTLTSLSTDIVNSISKKKLVGIPGSSILKDKTDYQELPKISQGRTPPNLEKIVSLKPDLVIGTKGFHDKILSKLNDINVRTLSYELKDWSSLEKTINLISNKIDVNDSKKVNEIININLNECMVINEQNKKNNVVVLASTQLFSLLTQKVGLEAFFKDLV